MNESKEPEKSEDEIAIKQYKRNSENKLIGLIILYVMTIILYFTARQDEFTFFDVIIAIIFLALTVYFVIEFNRYRKVSSFKVEQIK